MRTAQELANLNRTIALWQTEAHEALLQPACPSGTSGEFGLQKTVVPILPPIHDIDRILVRIQEDVEAMAK